MDALNRMWFAGIMEIEGLEKIVTAALKKSFVYFGEDAFRLRRGGRRSPIDMNVFETAMFMMAYFDTNSGVIKDKVQEEYHKLVASEEFRNNIGNHRASAVKLE